MSGSTYMARANQITKAYAYHLIGEHNRGTYTGARPVRRVEPNGQEYFLLPNQHAS